MHNKPSSGIHNKSSAGSTNPLAQFFTNIGLTLLLIAVAAATLGVLSRAAVMGQACFWCAVASIICLGLGLVFRGRQ